jgi:hypothetical protein
MHLSVNFVLLFYYKRKKDEETTLNVCTENEGTAGIS